MHSIARAYSAPDSLAGFGGWGKGGYGGEWIVDSGRGDGKRQE